MLREGNHTLLLRCIREFTTRENGGIPFTVSEGTVWYRKGVDYAPGGYEIVVMEQVVGGELNGVTAMMRTRYATECFDPVPLKECPLLVNGRVLVVEDTDATSGQIGETNG